MARQPRNVSLAVFDYLLIAFVIIMGLLILGPALMRKKESAPRASCQNNLKQMGIIFKMYSNEKNNAFPELSSGGNGLMLVPQTIYPEYLTDKYVLICPSDPRSRAAVDTAPNTDPIQFINDESYTYLGYVITNETELESFAAAYKDRIAKGLPFDSDLDVPPGTGTGGGDKILRLREGVERVFVTDNKDSKAAARAQSAIPVMWERCRRNTKLDPSEWFTHAPGGANVLFMDGHVQFVKYPGKFPVTEEACRILDELHNLKLRPTDGK